MCVYFPDLLVVIGSPYGRYSLTFSLQLIFFPEVRIKSFTLLFPTSRLDVKYDVIYRVFNHFSDLIIII